MLNIITAVLFIVISLLELSFSLVELPVVQDNDILKTEAVIRETANELFSILKIKEKYFKSPLEQYFIAHNYFISTTLQDYVILKEIARTTRVDNSDDIIAFIDFLNEILNENTDSQVYEVFHDEDVLKTIDHLVNDIPHGTDESNTDAHQFNAQILSQLEKPVDINPIDDNEIDLQEDYDVASNESVAESEVWVPEPRTRRIFDGTITKIKHYPFLAVIQLFNQFYCAGSIIAADLVITAASCVQLAWNNRFFRENPAFLSVRVGSTFYTGGGEVINVGEVYFHPTYNPKNLRDNICILRLVRSLKFGRKGIKRRIKRIEIDRAAQGLAVNTDGIIIVGWGARDSSNNIKGAWVNRLAYSVLDVYPNPDCKDVYSKEYVGRTNFCAGFISKGSGACNRDVGAPGVVGGFLVGIVSFGSAVCGAPDYPTVFTKVGFYADWIEEIMEMDVPQKFADTTLTTPFLITNPVYIQTTTFVMRPIVDVNEAQYSDVGHDIARNRYPDKENDVRVSSKSAELRERSEETMNKKHDGTGRITGILSDTTTKKIYKESSEETPRIKRKKKKKHRNAIRAPTPKMAMEENIEKEFEKIWGTESEEKEAISDYGEVTLATRNTNTRNTNIGIQTKLPENVDPETTVASRILEDSTEFKTTKKLKRRKKKKKKKKKKKNFQETTTELTTKKKKTTTELNSLHEDIPESTLKKEKTTTELNSIHEDIPKVTSDPNIKTSASLNSAEIKPKAKLETTTVPDHPANPLDTLSQKEFYALLAEVLDKLERDNSKEALK